ncbi:MAG: hypothetical protein KA713_01175 [Chryseotalea sp. WA131a]|nr:MAG: hypothetical protein KA713_01175 [Chryseotalea sp. WA131a]
MKLDFIERLGYYFFLSVGLIAIPYLTLATLSDILDIGPDDIFFLSILLGLTIANNIFSRLTVGQFSIRNVLTSIFVSLVGLTFFQLTIKKLTDGNFSIGGLSMILTTLICWEIVFFVQRKINSR